MAVSGALLLCASFAGGSLAVEAELAAGAPAMPADEVAPLTVRAERGPGWWRVSRGEAVVWILGVPESTPPGLRFDTTALERRIRRARLLVSEPLEQTSAYVGYCPAATHPAYPPHPPSRDPGQAATCTHFYRTQPSQSAYPRLPAIDADQPAGKFLGLGVKALDQQTLTASVELKRKYPGSIIFISAQKPIGSGLRSIQGYVLGGTNLTLSDLPVREAVKIAGAAGVRGVQLQFGAQAANMLKSVYIDRQPLEKSNACARQVFSALIAQGPAERLAAAQRWAEGDVRGGLKRQRTLHLCPIPSVDPYIWGRLITERFAAIRDALQTPGETVAVFWLDPLMAEGGVIDRLKAAGYEVEEPY